MFRTKAQVESDVARAETEAMREALRTELERLAALLKEADANAAD